MADSWLIVWAGSHDWQMHVPAILQDIPAQSKQAHVILSEEVEGSRWSLLLVHYTKAECDAIAAKLTRLWDFGFVNAVLDLAD